MTIQRQVIVLIVLGIFFGFAFMLFVALNWWAVLVEIVCGAGGGTAAASWIRFIRPHKALELSAAGNSAQH